MLKKKRVSRKALVSSLDKYFSQYIRLKNSVDGMATCVTCGDSKPWKEMQNGHYYSRGRFNTRWDDDNCHVQCMRCNVYLKGNYIQYTLYMLDTYGREFVDQLGVKSVNPTKISSIELKSKIEEYKKKVSEMLEST